MIGRADRGDVVHLVQLILLGRLQRHLGSVARTQCVGVDEMVPFGAIGLLGADAPGYQH